MEETNRSAFLQNDEQQERLSDAVVRCVGCGKPAGAPLCRRQGVQLTDRQKQPMFVTPRRLTLTWGDAKRELPFCQLCESQLGWRGVAGADFKRLPRTLNDANLRSRPARVPLT